MGKHQLAGVVFTIALASLLVLAFGQSRSPLAFAAESGGTAATALEPGPSAPATSRALVAGPATLPLRWRVTFVRQTDTTSEFGSNGHFCGTAIVVMNLTNSAVKVQVEYFDGYNGATSKGYSQLTVTGQKTLIWWTDNNPTLWPIGKAEDIVGTGAMSGYATVHAEHPQVHASAHLVCRDSLDLDVPIDALTNIPTIPVGPTLEFFQIGMPMTDETPLVAEPKAQQ